MMTMRTHVPHLLGTAALSLLLAGCGGGGGGGGNGAQQSFVSSVQQAASTSSDEAEPAELTVDAGGDTGADYEPLAL